VLGQSTHHVQQAGEYGFRSGWAVTGGDGWAWTVGARGSEAQVECEIGGVDFLAVEGGVVVVGYGEGEGFRGEGCGGLFWVCNWGGKGGG
jgi:hypothetical protein